MPATDPIPFKRKAESLPELPGNSFTRLVLAKVIASLGHLKTRDVVEQLWPGDLILRAASAPAMTTVTGWAAELVHRIIADALTALGPDSSAVKVLSRGLVLAWNGAGQISAPGIVGSASNAGFVAEGAPIPVRQLLTSPCLLSPFKLASISVLTREMIESGNAERLVTDALTRSCGAALDVALFGSAAASAAQPAGLRSGIAATTPSASTDPFGAVFEDVTTLINAIAPVAGPGPYVIVANPGRAMMIRSRLPDDYQSVGLTLFGSAAVGNDIVAIAPAAVVSAFSPDPEIEAGTAGTLHMDTAPVADPGSTGDHKSLFQTESIAVKVRWPVSWALRNAAGVAWLTPIWK